MKLFPLVICGLLTGAAAAQSLAVVPARALIDETVAIRATGLAPHERVAIHAALTDGGGQQWASKADFVADAQGTVDVSRQAPTGGSYKEVSPMGLIWSMMPLQKGVSAYMAPRNLGVQTVDFQLLRQGQEAARAHLEQLAVAEGVHSSPVHEDGLRGTLVLPPGAGPHAAVLVLGGSNGGVPLRPAAWVASHGYAALALAYFRYQDLPPQLESIPLEYFQKALQWMTDRPEIGNAKIAVLGTSRGGELALQLGSMFSRIGAVVAYVPSNVRVMSCCRQNGGPAWIWQGRALSYVVPRRSNAGDRARAAIAVENTRGPILMISGEADRLWNSWEMADEAVSRLKGRQFPYSFENLKYPHAGHLAGRQEFIPAWHGEIRNPTSGRENNLGGSAEGDARSTIDSMPKVLEFLRRNLAGQ
ncbi:MAG TPA: acyl-CoA thioesterase/bile acid-CoA:amino acid N-acyltransferase family protein [Bryobacteraceae bacterium]|jgi:dienelactone hydrolase|nr:acyl-CoA thioesterase/bile acid-CoA:amino acid N-acyltransferase family protein [Bryobacteraceae bacterium]